MIDPKTLLKILIVILIISDADGEEDGEEEEDESDSEDDGPGKIFLLNWVEIFVTNFNSPYKWWYSWYVF